MEKIKQYFSRHKGETAVGLIVAILVVGMSIFGLAPHANGEDKAPPEDQTQAERLRSLITVPQASATTTKMVEDAGEIVEESKPDWPEESGGWIEGISRWWESKGLSEEGLVEKNDQLNERALALERREAELERQADDLSSKVQTIGEFESRLRGMTQRLTSCVSEVIGHSEGS